MASVTASVSTSCEPGANSIARTDRALSEGGMNPDGSNRAPASDATNRIKPVPMVANRCRTDHRKAAPYRRSRRPSAFSSCPPGLRKYAASSGVISRATSSENSTCTDTVIPNCLKNCPETEDRKLTGRNTATIVRLIAITARPISSAASSAARYGDLPIWMWRTMFSISTMASSTRMPTLSVIASRLTMLSEKPSRFITQKAGMIDNGSVMAAMMVDRQSRRNRNTTTTARTAPSYSVCIAASKLPSV